MEDYKKKYEEALDNFKKIKAANKNNKELVDFIEYEYPELKESNDERIRKEILEYFKQFDNMELRGAKISDWIAWLEKQGEQKSKKVSLWKHWKDGIAGNEEGKLTYLIKIGNTYFLTSCLGFECDYIELSELDSLTLEKQGEQKPAWSKENSCYYDDICEILINLINSPTSNVNKDAIQKDLDWLMSIGESQLKSAWSEKDENMLQKALSTIRYALSIPADKEDDPCFVGSSTITWLKSLKERYTWKPNRGQIEAIEDAIKFLGCTKKVREDLKSLYEQLKKLREE